MFAMAVILHFLILSILCFHGSESADQFGVLSRSQILSKIKSSLEMKGGSGTQYSVEDIEWLWRRLRFKPKDCKEHTDIQCKLVSQS